MKTIKIIYQNESVKMYHIVETDEYLLLTDGSAQVFKSIKEARKKIAL